MRRSNPVLLCGPGSLRGACHRARIRATRWLAMTVEGLPIAVKTIVAIVITAAAVAAIVDPEHTLDGPHRAADAGADRAADHATDGTGNPVAFPGALLRPADDALGMAGMGNCEQGENERRRRKEFCRQTGRQRRGLDLDHRFHLNSL